MCHGTRRNWIELVGRFAVRHHVSGLVALLSLVISSPVALSATDWNRESEMAAGLPTMVAPEIELAPEATRILKFHRAAATSFSPFDYTTNWAYEGAGCRSQVSGNAFYDLDVQIPDGETLDQLRVYYYDTDGSNDVGATLFSVDGAGGFTEIASVEGSGTPGYGSVGTVFSHIVDTHDEAIVVRLYMTGGTDSTLRACGVRLRSSIPALFADGFESGGTAAWDVTVP